MRQLKWHFISVLCLIFLLMLSTVPAYADSEVERVRSIINQQYVDTVPAAVNEADTIDQMLQALGDPYAEYFTPAEFLQFKQALDQTFVGIGIVFDVNPQGVIIKNVLNQSPAEQSGLLTDDVILSADGNSLANKDITAAGNLIRGLENTKLNLRVKRGQTIFTVTITRHAIDLPSVNYRILQHHIGYVDIDAFSSDTGLRFGEAIADLQKQGAISWIIDLRDNGGGYLEAARLAAGYFIPGQTCFFTDNRYFNSRSQEADRPGNTLNGPITVLVNDRTASASEVLAGALQDYNKAIIIGQTTYGKGSVQWLFDLGSDGVLKLTCEKYRTPLGRQVNKIGIAPDLPTTVDSLKIAELILSGQSLTPDRIKTRVSVHGHVYPISLTLANSFAYQHVYNELLKLSRPARQAG
ncbi:MAG: S41 family peptidase [Methylocystaceae bacterium]